MSIGASLIGAVVLVFATDLISEKKIYNDRTILLSEAINAAKLVLEEIDNLVDELYDANLPFGFSNLKELKTQCDIITKNHIKNKNLVDSNYLKMKETLYKTILSNTFLIGRCHYAQTVFGKICGLDSYFIVNEIINNNELELFRKAELKLSSFMYNITNNNFPFLPINGLDFDTEMTEIALLDNKK